MSKSKVDWVAELPNIKAMGLAGDRMPQIAEKYGVSKQRIKQILKLYVPEWKKLIGEDTDLYKIQKHKYTRKKAAARYIGYTWDISFKDIRWPTHCPILGLELDYFAEVVQENSPSFDLITRSLGYVTGNVQIISWRANRIKNNGTSEEHRKIAEYIDSIVG